MREIQKVLAKICCTRFIIELLITAAKHIERYEKTEFELKNLEYLCNKNNNNK